MFYVTLILMDQIITYPYPTISKTNFNLMTYNLGFCAGNLGLKGRVYSKKFIVDNLSRICSTVTQENIDILCVQEIDLKSRRSFFIDQIDFIAKSCQFPYVFLVGTWNHKWVPYPSVLDIRKQFGPTVACQAIFSKFPLSSPHTLEFRKPKSNTAIYNFFYINRLSQFVTVKISENRTFKLCNIHFDAYHSDEREDQAKQTIQEITEEDVVFCGDFNCKTNSEEETLSGFTSNGFNEVLSAKHIPTFPSCDPKERLDYIFCSKGITVNHANVLKKDSTSSDHFPVTANLSVLL